MKTQICQSTHCIHVNLPIVVTYISNKKFPIPWSVRLQYPKLILVNLGHRVAISSDNLSVMAGSSLRSSEIKDAEICLINFLNPSDVIFLNPDQPKVFQRNFLLCQQLQIVNYHQVPILHHYHRHHHFHMIKLILILVLDTS